MGQELLQPRVVADRWDECLWDELLAHIDEQRVIPIIGPDLVQVQIGGTPARLESYVAVRLAAKLSLSAEALPLEPSLNDVVCRFLENPRNRRESLYSRIGPLLKEAAFAPPKALLQLAEISDFNLFVTTTFDTLLEDALNQTRFAGTARTASIAYSPNNVNDLPCPKENLRQPSVYHLLGKLSPSPSYVVSDEDMLEFVCALQSESKQPVRLLDELQNNHLLILGSHFSDWLARFFLRTAKRRRLSDPREVLEILADSRTCRDSALGLFLTYFSSRTLIFPCGAAVEFVEELWRRWRQRHPADGPVTLPRLPPPADMPAHAAFISYAHEDLAAVKELKAGLDHAGLTAWFDAEQLEVGDSFTHKIKNNIRNCSCFLPVLSQHTENRLEGYFRREWYYALERDMGIHPDKCFILPVVVDDTPTFVNLPDRFQEVHRIALPDGRVTPEFVSRVKKVVGYAT